MTDKDNLNNTLHTKISGFVERLRDGHSPRAFIVNLDPYGLEGIVYKVEARISNASGAEYMRHTVTFADEEFSDEKTGGMYGINSILPLHRIEASFT